jgi:hypothetical protein
MPRGEESTRHEYRADIAVIGGGTGGVSAALAAVRLGATVIMTEETDWIGGQLTAQAVPPDEHPWIESTGATASYRYFRRLVREHYIRKYPLKDPLLSAAPLNPGNGAVSALCFEPRVGEAVLREMLAPYAAEGLLTMLNGARPIGAEVDGDRVRTVVVEDRAGTRTGISARYFLDATELGDLLELSRTEHVIGSESQRDTGEPHALAGDPDPLDQQALSWCFALDIAPAEDNVIDAPSTYEFWKDYRPEFWPGPLFGWCDVYPHTLAPHRRGIFFTEPSPDGRDDCTLWRFRRILDRNLYAEGLFPSDISLVNWPHIDYWLGPLVGVSDQDRARHWNGAAQMSLSFLHWMQTEAPRHDGGRGYPELRLRRDVVGTGTGLAMHPYIRESRRIRAERTVTEQQVCVDGRRGLGAERFDDSVGVGSYRIDLHPSTGNRNYVDLGTYPFEIPLGSLIPVRMENLLPACKNIGTTHVTNGCYRLHPVEWNIGEAAGALAVFCMRHAVVPRQIRDTERLLREFQTLLGDCLGFVLHWPDYARLIER